MSGHMDPTDQAARTAKTAWLAVVIYSVDTAMVANSEDYAAASAVVS